MAILFTGSNPVVVRLYAIIYRLLRLVIRKPSIRGLEHIRNDTPSVFVANHLGSYGPVSLMAFLPFPVFPWVTSEVTDSEACAGYIEKDFVVKELGLRPPMSTLLAAAIGKICVSIMGCIKAIPVYKNSRRISESIDVSRDYLREGRDLLIFPELPDEPINDQICKFDSGFINIAKRRFEADGEIVSFYPVAVNRKTREITLGTEVTFDPERRFMAEKRRIRQELEKRISMML